MDPGRALVTGSQSQKQLIEVVYETRGDSGHGTLVTQTRGKQHYMKGFETRVGSVPKATAGYATALR